MLCAQNYVSMSKAVTCLSRQQWNCPYRRKCEYRVALSIKEYRDGYELLQSGAHYRSSHRQSKGILSVK